MNLAFAGLRFSSVPCRNGTTVPGRNAGHNYDELCSSFGPQTERGLINSSAMYQEVATNEWFQFCGGRDDYQSFILS